GGGQVVDQAEGEAPEGRGEAPHVGHQVRLEKLRRVEEEAGERHGSRGGAGDEAAALESGELGNRRVSEILEDHYRSNSLRRSAGTSASVACSLNCSART